MTTSTTPSPFTETTGPARHAAFAELATTGPVQKVMLFTGVPAWVVTGYAEARELLAHPALVKIEGGGPHMDAMPPDLNAAMNTHLLGTNPPDHTRLRRLVTAAFTVRRIEALAPRVQEITDALLDALEGEGDGPVDLVDGFGFPLPITVITELLGIPPGDRADFRRWSSVTVNGTVHPPEVYVDAARSMVGYVRELIGAKRADPGDDLLSALIAVHEGGDRLSVDELTSMVFLLLVAGHETTVNLIVSGTYALLRNPDQLALLRAEPDRLPAAVEELLRYDGPVQVTIPAVAAAPIDVGGVTIPAGEIVLPALLAANRDPSRFPEPDRLDITRPSNAHMAFGHGLHHCLGAPLARLEGRIALGTLINRFPRLRLADPAGEPARNPGLLMNGLVALPVVLG
ncbi:cytochrome P450 family protein [Pseudonocardia cypriaca]|uniref:Cytochrome P450 n=1 Tax=Pseudonocardia cypriaca TaxID=882449 RepID=A0A543FWK1_9PSEU|nr:cytochrome P450 [Pseudonocardia cypriaca]TQM38212.1 cytochrome P450 [Pseudonocardia cypriaca]